MSKSRTSVVGTPYRSVRTVPTVKVVEDATPERSVERSTRAANHVTREHPAVRSQQSDFKRSPRSEAEDRIGSK
jgi:hypothetical protein